MTLVLATSVAAGDVVALMLEPVRARAARRATPSSSAE